MKLTIAGVIASVAVATLVPLSAPANAVEDAATSLATLRQNTVDRAKSSMGTPAKFQISAGGTKLLSKPVTNNNYLSTGVAYDNVNRNQFNGYNGDPWCGWWAAAMWTGVNTPNPDNFPNIPTNYPSSQAWRTDSGGRYHKFSRTVLPLPADVVIWQNGSGTAGVDNGIATGHVGIVIKVNTMTKQVTVIEGNTKVGTTHASIALKTYAWDADGPTISGKHFMGFTSRG